MLFVFILISITGSILIPAVPNFYIVHFFIQQATIRYTWTREISPIVMLCSVRCLHATRHINDLSSIDVQ